MLAYVIATLLSVGLAIMAQPTTTFKGKYFSKGLRTLFEALSIVPLTYLAAYRVNVGTDYYAYVEFFYHPKWFQMHFSPLFYGLGSMLAKISNNSQVFFIVTSIIIYTITFIVIYYESDSFGLSILFFVISEDYFVSLNIVSQFIAIAIVCVSILFFRAKKYIASIILLIVALFFHQAAFCIIALYLSYWIFKDFKKMIAFTGLITVGALIGIPILIKLISHYTSYGRYFNSNYANTQYSVAIPMLIIFLGLCLITIVMCGNKINNNSKIKLFLYSSIIAIETLLLSFKLTGNTYRLTYYFSCALYMYFPSVIKAIPVKKSKYIITVIVIVLLSIWTILLITHNNQNVLPYQSIFSR